MPNRPLKIFLCHAKEDKPTVRELYHKLSAEGWLDIWLDEEKLFPGQDWNFEIEQAVDDADIILACLTKGSVNKEGYVQRELRIVLDLADYKPEGTLFIIPVRLEECDPPRRLRAWQYADYFPVEERPRAYERLLTSLKMRARKLEIPTVDPAEERARLEAEEKKRKQAEEDARKEKEARDKKEAEISAHKAAEERARLLAEEKERQVREENERKIAEERARQLAKQTLPLESASTLQEKVSSRPDVIVDVKEPVSPATSPVEVPRTNDPVKPRLGKFGWFRKNAVLVGGILGLIICVACVLIYYFGDSLVGGPYAPAPTIPVTSSYGNPVLKVGQVTDLGGIDDKSFNAAAFAGLMRAENELGIEGKYIESQQQSDYAKNIQEFLDNKTDLIITVGFLLGVDTAKAAVAHPEQKFAIVDYAFPDCWPGAVVGTDCGSDVALDNVLGLTFSSDQAAFLAGYAAAASTHTGKVATFGGINLPTVNIFMQGFEAGVKYYNQQKGTSVEVLGWDTAKFDGAFIGNFESLDDGRSFAQSFVQEGADIIMPVAGPVGLGSAAYCKETGACKIVGVDTDWTIYASEYTEVILTCVLKNMDIAVYDAIESVANGTFKGGVYVGTLKNGGVDISSVTGASPGLIAELEEIKQSLIDGSISINGLLNQ